VSWNKCGAVRRGTPPRPMPRSRLCRRKHLAGVTWETRIPRQSHEDSRPNGRAQQGPRTSTIASPVERDIRNDDEQHVRGLQKGCRPRSRQLKFGWGVGGLGVRVHQLRIVQVAGRNGGGGQSRSGKKSPEMSAARQQSARRPGCPVAGADESATYQGLKQPMLGHKWCALHFWRKGDFFNMWSDLASAALGARFSRI
jgi:hypothetical protein